MGACCSFNYHPTNPKYTPFVSNTFGIYGGLSVIGTGRPQIADGKSGVYFSAGFSVTLTTLQKFLYEWYTNFSNPKTNLCLNIVL